MLKNYFIVSFRSISKSRVYAFINIVGLSVGMCAFFLIHLYVDFEKSYDQDNPNKHRIYRLQQSRFNQGSLSSQSVIVAAAAGRSIAENFSSVEHYVNLLFAPAVLTYEGKSLEEAHFYFATEKFFTLFPQALLAGDPSTILTAPGTCLLSQSAAKRYFGDEDPMGKVLDLRGVFNLEVTGIYADMPANSHLRVDVMASMQTYLGYAGDYAVNSWRRDNYYSYLMLKEGADAKALEAGLPGFIQTQTGEWLNSTNQDMKLTLMPLTDIHLHSHTKNEMKPNGNYQMVFYLSLIAYFILVIAYINYINVATVKSFERSKEVGIRKVLGGYRTQLIKQFLAESFIFNCLAVVLSLVIAYFALPAFNTLSGRELLPETLFTPLNLFAVAGILLLGTFLSGLYPAMVLSGFRPVEVLKGKFTGSGRGNWLRKGLVTMQFATSLVLLICTFAVYEQIRFLQTESLGFNLDQVLIVKAPLKKDSLYENNLRAFKQQAVQLAGVETMTSIRETPGAPIYEFINTIKRKGAPDQEANLYQMISVDEDFLEVFDVKMVAGRMYNASDPTDYTQVVINERASEQFGFESPEEAVNKQIIWEGDEVNIIGVMSNYHHETLKYPVSPIIFPLDPGYGLYLPIRLNGERNHQQTIAALQSLFQSHFEGYPFNAYFLDEHYNQQYASDFRFGKVVALFSVVAIIITSLGLFGLSSYTVLLRTKEIGVRKVLGASVTGILRLLFRDYTVLITLAMVISVPVAWYLTSGWLENFENRIQLRWWMFVVPSLGVLLVAWTTISGHTFRAARANPVDTLRYE